MYDELIKRLREKAEAFDYDGWVETASDYEKAAEVIEELQKAVYFHKYNSEFWEDKYNSLADEKWIHVTEDSPSDFVSVQAHIVGANPLPTVREAYVIGGKWFFPALKEFLPVDMWKRFDEPPKEE